MPLEFILFGIMLLGVAVLHRRPMAVALAGLSAIMIYELFVSGFPGGPGLAGLALHFENEWVSLADILLLLAFRPHKRDNTKGACGRIRREAAALDYAGRWACDPRGLRAELVSQI